MSHPFSLMNPSSHPFWVKAAFGSAAVAASTLLSTSMAMAAPTPVDLELFLSVDVSGSVDNIEFDLQKTGYANAFRDIAIQEAIASKPNGVAVALGQWSSTANTPILGWSLLKTAADADAFATAIDNITRQSFGGTCVACGINAAVNEIQTNDYVGTAIIDVSGDGSENVSATNGPATTAGARDAAAALGIKINGLPILGSEFGLEQWYKDNVITSDGFTIAASSFADFDAAVKLKIEKELNPDTVPGPLPILGAGVAFGFSRRLRKRINLATLA